MSRPENRLVFRSLPLYNGNSKAAAPAAGREVSVMIGSQEFWNRRARIYDQQVGPLYEAAYDKTVANTLRYLRPDFQVLDFACGTGITTAQIAPHVASVRAIDISAEMAARARGKVDALGLTNVEVSHAQIWDPSLTEGSFDAVTAFNVLCYLPDRPQVLARIRALLKPGGLFLSATDCLGEKLTRVGLKKWWNSHTGAMPYVAFDSMRGLERAVADAGFQVVERENLFPAPPNLFLAGVKK